MAEENQGIGARLRAARVAQGIEIETLARELKYTRAVLQAIETGDWSRLGAPVFARNLVGRYAARLGVSVDLDAVVQRLEAPVLKSHVPVSRFGRFADFSARHAAYAGGSLLVLSMVYGALSLSTAGPSQYRSLDPTVDQPMARAILASPADTGPAGDEARSGDEAQAGTPVATAPEAPGTVIAEPPLPEVGAPAAPKAVAASFTGGVPSPRQLELRFSGDSWIEVMRRDGSAIERVLARAGEVRRYPTADVGRVTVGNVDATEVVVDGSRVNLDAVRAANVARFALSSEGSIEAVAR